MTDDEFREQFRRALAAKARRRRTRSRRRGGDPMARAQLAPRYIPPPPRPIRSERKT